jgi:hypothetical protein
MSPTNACLVPVAGYSYKRACGSPHIITGQDQPDRMHAAHWERQRALCVYLGPMQELLLRRIIAMPGCSQRAAVAAFRWRGNRTSVLPGGDADLRVFSWS